MIRIAIIGTGGMAHVHAQKFKAIRGCKVTACCDIVAERAGEFAERYGIAKVYEDAEELLCCERLDGVSVVTPDNAHCEPVLQAVKHGLHVMCEKPLADNLRDARRMSAAAKRKGVLTAMNFTYRDNAATQKAARLVAAGRIGRVIHFEGSYLQSWLCSKVWGNWRTTEMLLWRLSTRHGSMGCLGDLGVHLYDLLTFIGGDIAELHCELKTFDKGVKKIGPYVFDANDSFITTARLQNGAVGTLHSSRWATGHSNTVALRIYGDRGALDLNLDRPLDEQLRGCIGKRRVDQCRWEAIKCPQTPNMYHRFVSSIRSGRQGQTGFAAAAKVQASLHYSMISAEKGSFVRVGY